MRIWSISLPAVCCLMSLFAERGASQENFALDRVLINTLQDNPAIRSDEPNSLGTLPVGADPIDVTGRIINPERREIEIIRIGNAPGESDYKLKKDFTGYNGWAIQWLADGKHPRRGATYFVTCKYVASEKGHQGDSHGGYLTDGRSWAWMARAPAWIYVGLSGEKTVGRVVVRQESGTNSISEKIVIQYAKPGIVDLEDDKSWKNVVPFDGRLKNPLEKIMTPVIDFRIQPVKSRYFRLVVEKGSTNNFGYISEWELYAP